MHTHMLCTRTCYAHAHLQQNLGYAHSQVALSVLLVHPKLGNMGYLGMAAARSLYATRGSSPRLE